MGNDTTDPNASARVDKIVELAEANGGGFVPEYDYTTVFGEQVTGQLGVLLFPDRNTTDDNPFDKQPLIIGVELAKLGDRVWLDSDADGIQDAGENGIEGVTVNLLADTDNDGQIDDVVHTTTTDADGNYHFEVIAGDYVVEFEQPEGFEVSPANQGTDDTVDSDGLISDVVTLSSGESNPTIDQGFYQTASLGDFVFEDSNADGIQDAGETGIGGVEVTLLADTDNDGNIDDVVDTATTAADGRYEFTGLTPGVEYQVEFTQPSGFDSVSPRQQGGDPAVDSDGLLSDVVVLASGENNPTIDAGFFNTASLGDFVFEDSNANGIQDTGETGIGGVEVTLLADTDNDGNIDDVVDTATTAPDGSYEFTGLTPGVEYQVEFTQPSGFDSVSPRQQGGDPALDSDGLLSDVVVLASGENNPTIDAGFFNTASLGDFVFEDTNANGIQDTGETGIGGVEVTLLADTDNDWNIDDVVDTATTAPDGSYEFTGLTPGVEYQVEFTQPSGFDSVSPRQQGGDPAVDSDGLLSDVVVLASGENNPTIDAGFFNTAGLGDFVFEDTNGNGIQDSGEAGVEGVEVQLQNPDGTPVTDGNGDPITTTTDANGFYSFEGLTPGEYKVKFVAPDGFKFTTPNVGDDDTIDSDADPTMDGMTETVILESGDFNGTLDAGLVQPASLGDFVFEDSNANGIQDAGEVGIAGVEVKLLADTDNDGLIDDVVGITTTSADGSYFFPSLAPGVEYKVMFSQPGGFDGVSPRQAGNDPSIDSDGLMSDVVVLASGEFNPTIDAGFFKTAGLGDFVFEDTNGNGIQDSGEAGVSGVEVQLQNPDGTPVTDGNGDPITTTTDADGEYAFTGLTPGEYKVTFVAPEGFEFTTPNVGDDNAVDSDADPDNGMTETVILESGDFNGTLDAGLIRLIPDIDIEKFTNGVDADTPDAAAEIIVGDTVTWTYEVTNTGDVPFDESEILVTDDQEGTITDIIDQADGDNTLAPGETWIYQKTGTAQDLSTATNNVIDFETDGEGNALPAGTVIDDEYQNLGLTISATKFGAMIFDRANPTGGDFDLATDSEGNILIISEDGDSNDPDDNAGGGVITLDLDNPVDFNSINLVDIEETGGEVRTTDSDGNVVTTAIPAPGDGSLQTLNINDSDVVKIEVELVGSGAISGLDFDTFSDGIYKNIGTVVADGVEDSDHSHYVSLTPDPDIDIEKFVNGIDANSPDEYPELNPGSNVTFTYDVTNTGNVAFAAADVIVTDDNGTADDSNDDFNPEQVLDGGFNVGDVNQNNFLDVGETWKYSATDTVQELLTSETIHIEAEDFYELNGYEIEYNDFASGHELIRVC
ncbi:SdrD B-like domain-containing protein [Crocosphaera watsonii WH 8501]|uniref:Thrombospondin type 3 repeat:Cna B-type n=2 Tax=Crocosphaera watsonii TaxID=263511 RepID=Q4C637_CROWT|nr:SdrD B-like domain-containing protein [Crocosphaera watsonii]EAM51570.1 Thrombospondin type 3 repeat:Cna B-type [Crocosphaera watsonii WH 8501]